MGLESNVTKISDLNQDWPLNTDLRSYGDDHLRNIKKAVRSLLAITGLGDIGFPSVVAGKAGQVLHLNTGETAYELKQADHVALLNKGTNTHAQIDATLGALSTTYAPIAKGVTNGDAHDHLGGDGAQIDHVNLANKGTNTHTQIDTHISAGAFVARGDPSVYDKTADGFVKDGAYHDWDLSAIVPAGAKAVLMKVCVLSTPVGGAFALRKNGNVNNVSDLAVLSYLTSTTTAETLVVPCDGNRVIEYFAANTTWNLIGVVVVGWFF